MEKHLTVKGVAELLQVHPQTVREWLRDGKLEGVKFGARSWRVPMSALSGGGQRGATTLTPLMFADSSASEEDIKAAKAKMNRRYGIEAEEDQQP